MGARYNNSNRHFLKCLRSFFPLTSVNDVVLLLKELITPSLREFRSSERLKSSLLQTFNANIDILQLSIAKDINDFSDNVNVSPEPYNSQFAIISIIIGLIEDKITRSLLPKSQDFHPRTRSKPRKTESKSRKDPITAPLTVDTNLSASSSATVSSTLTASPTISRLKRRTRRASGSSIGRNRKRHASQLSMNDSLEDASPAPSSQREYDSGVPSDASSPVPSFPCVTYDSIESLYSEFERLFQTHPKTAAFYKACQDALSSNKQAPCASLELIASVTEVVHGRLQAPKNKDKFNHSQTVYSFIVYETVDGFGLALTMAAACQLLGYSDVHLVLSEDHAWLEYGPDRETADISRYFYEQTVAAHPSLHTSSPLIRSHANKPPEQIAVAVPEACMRSSWLYVKNKPFRCCHPVLSLCSIVAAIQPSGPAVPVAHGSSAASSVSTLSESPSPLTVSDWIRALSPTKRTSGSPSYLLSTKLIDLKHRLLWLLYENGLLARYPVGLTNLADLEEMFPSAMAELETPEADVGSTCPTSRRLSDPTALALYYQAAHVARLYYGDAYVYPYLHLANSLHRRGQLRGAMHYWSEAASVISQYNHNSEDNEVYKELLEVATVVLPSLAKAATHEARSCAEGQLATDPVDGTVYRPDNILDDPQCLAYVLAFVDNLCVWEEGSSVPVLHVGWVDKLMSVFSRFSERARKLVRFKVAVGQEERSSPKRQIIPPGRDLMIAGDSPVVSPEEAQRPPSASTSSSFSVPSAQLEVDREALLDSLASFCGERLLNPGFLMGVQPEQPWLPVNTRLRQADDVVRSRFSECGFMTPPHAASDHPDLTTSCFSPEEEKCQIDRLRRELMSAASSVGTESDMDDLPFFHAEANADEEEKVQDALEKMKEDEPVDGKLAVEGEASETIEDARLVYVTLRSRKMGEIVELWTSPGRLNVAAIKLALTAQTGHGKGVLAGLATSIESPTTVARRTRHGTK